MSCASKCDGSCCAVFVFSSPREDLKTRWDNVPEPLTQSEAECKADNLYVHDMLIEITDDEAVLRANRFGFPPIEAGGRQQYTCRHWNEETRLCGAYESRPIVCSEFPYGKACAHCGNVEGETREIVWK